MNSTESSHVYEKLQTERTRLHYLDNLRALAMIGGVFFHAALAYSPMLHHLWLTADSQQSEVVDIVSWFSHLFRMPVFFCDSRIFCRLPGGKTRYGRHVGQSRQTHSVAVYYFLAVVFVGDCGTNDVGGCDGGK